MTGMRRLGVRVPWAAPTPPVTHESGEAEWFGLGRISVDPALRRQGVDAALISEGRRWLSDQDAREPNP